jgi:hypothetical protein
MTTIATMMRTRAIETTMATIEPIPSPSSVDGSFSEKGGRPVETSGGGGGMKVSSKSKVFFP